MRSCQRNIVISAAVHQPDSFIFTDRRSLGARKQAVRVLALYKPDHHTYRVNNVDINSFL